MIRRCVDILMAFFLLLVLAPALLILAILVKATSRGPVFYLSDRIGRNNQVFKMFKFRTMRVDTPPVATHLLKDPGCYLTPVGSFLRRLSLDELPQLLNVIRGNMTFVGPRPALFNQDDLVALRTTRGVQALLPGITGWAQVNGRDDLPIPVKVEFDSYYLKHKSFLFDLRILFLTVAKVLKKEGVTH